MTFYLFKITDLLHPAEKKITVWNAWGKFGRLCNSLVKFFCAGGEAIPATGINQDVRVAVFESSTLWGVVQEQT